MPTIASESSKVSESTGSVTFLGLSNDKNDRTSGLKQQNKADVKQRQKM